MNKIFTVCSYVLAGVVTILDAKINPMIDTLNALDHKVNVLATNLEAWKEEVRTEIEFLGNVSWSNEQKLSTMQKTRPISAQSTAPNDLPATSDTSGGFKFPLKETSHLEAFENELENEEQNAKWFKHFVEALKFKPTLYGRRKFLKELLFAE